MFGELKGRGSSQMPSETGTKNAAPAPASDYESLKLEGNHWILAKGERADADPSGLVPAVTKAICALALINASSSEMTLAAIAEESGITKSHCHSILKTLVHHDWLFFDASRKSYRLNVGIQRDLSSMLRDVTPFSLIKPLIEELPARTNASCILSEPLSDGGFMVVAKASAPGQLEISYPIGHRFPSDASAQMRARLAWADDDEIASWFEGWEPVKYATATMTAVEEIKAELVATRSRGYARSIGEFTEGLTALALPIFDHRGKVIFILDSIGLSLAMARRETEIAAEMSKTVAQIQRLIGSAAPKRFPIPLARFA